MAVIASFLAGLLFGGGLILSGMADPAIVLGFFNVTEAWNPALAFVMAGGLGVTALGYGLVLKRWKPLWAKIFQIPTRRDIDAKLIGGAALFGLGWGLAGYCPGPALVASAAGVADALWFTAAMVAGMAAWRVVTAPPSARP